MAGTIVSVFDTRELADQAAHELLQAGIPVNDISIVHKHAGGETGSQAEVGVNSHDGGDTHVSHEVREVPIHDVTEPLNASAEAAPRAAVGVVGGSALGVIAVATAVVFPGLMPLIVAGPLVALMTGGVAGGVIGGLVGGLTAGGVPEQEAQRYHDFVEQGKTLVTVLASSEQRTIADSIFRKCGGHDPAYYRRLEDTVQRLES